MNLSFFRPKKGPNNFVRVKRKKDSFRRIKMYVLISKVLCFDSGTVISLCSTPGNKISEYAVMVQK